MGVLRVEDWLGHQEVCPSLHLPDGKFCLLVEATPEIEGGADAETRGFAQVAASKVGAFVHGTDGCDEFGGAVAVYGQQSAVPVIEPVSLHHNHVFQSQELSSQQKRLQSQPVHIAGGDGKDRLPARLAADGGGQQGGVGADGPAGVVGDGNKVGRDVRPPRLGDVPGTREAKSRR